MELSRGFKRTAMGALAALLVLASSIFTYAEEGREDEKTEAVSISLEKAVDEAIKNSNAIQISELERETREIELNEARYSEKSYKDLGFSLGTVEGFQLSKQFYSTAADYALEEEKVKQEKNIEDIKYNVTNAYYGVLNAKSALDASIDNLDNTKRSQEIVAKKYELGVASKSDFLIAQYSVDEAVASMENAQNSYKDAMMALNMLMDYPLDKELALTSTYSQGQFEAKLDQDIEKAYGKRLDVIQLVHGYELSKLEFDTNALKYTPNTFEYKKKELAVKKSEQSLDNLKLSVEYDIRQKYNAINSQRKNIEIKKAAVEKAKEALRLTEISYDAGYKTILDVREARNVLYYAQIGYNSEVLQYNLSIINYNKAVNIGGN